jgi:hypothetical protein
MRFMALRIPRPAFSGSAFALDHVHVKNDKRKPVWIR